MGILLKLQCLWWKNAIDNVCQLTGTNSVLALWYQLISPWTKRWHFGRQEFQMYFVNQNKRTLNQISLKFVQRSPFDNIPAVGSDKGLAKTRQQAILWTNADPFHRCVYVALRGDEVVNYLNILINAFRPQQNGNCFANIIWSTFLWMPWINIQTDLNFMQQDWNINRNISLCYLKLKQFIQINFMMTPLWFGIGENMLTSLWSQIDVYYNSCWAVPDSKVHEANMEPSWVLSAPDGPHVGPTNLAIRDTLHN